MFIILIILINSSFNQTVDMTATKMQTLVEHPPLNTPNASYIWPFLIACGQCVKEVQERARQPLLIYFTTEEVQLVTINVFVNSECFESTISLRFNTNASDYKDLYYMTLRAYL